MGRPPEVCRRENFIVSRLKIGGTTLLKPTDLYIDALENGTPLAVKAASVAVATLLVLLVAVPVLAIGAAVVA